MKLLIVTECEHFRRNDKVFAPRHFVREISLWATMFSSVELLTRFPPWPLIGDLVSYSRRNIKFVTANSANSKSVPERFVSLGRSTLSLLRMIRGFVRCDFIHIRCPSRNGLIALLLQRIFRKPCYIKWAGNWDLDKSVPLTSHWQRALIRSNPGPTLATVYKRSPKDPLHVHATATSSLSSWEVEMCISTEKPVLEQDKIHLLWVGRFSANKNVEGLIEAFRFVQKKYPGISLDLVGDGLDRDAIEMMVSREGLSSKVTFHGSLKWDELKDLYCRSYLNLLPSYSEGFPKVVLEAMMFGTPSVVFAVGALPTIVKDRGIAVSPVGDIGQFAKAVCGLISDAKTWGIMSQAARNYAAGISIEVVVDEYRCLLEKTWGVSLQPLV